MKLNIQSIRLNRVPNIDTFFSKLAHSCTLHELQMHFITADLFATFDDVELGCEKMNLHSK